MDNQAFKDKKTKSTITIKFSYLYDNTYVSNCTIQTFLFTFLAHN